MSEHFFTGTTQAGRELHLFYEHTAFETYDTDEGPYDDPTETQITGTLDGEPINVEGLTWSGDSATVRTERGTFAAVSTDSDESHSEALRRYLEWRPSAGWNVEIVNRAQDGDVWCYTVSITNGRVIERAEFRLSDQVARLLAGDRPLPPPDEAVQKEIASTVRSENWSKIEHRAQEPTTLFWRAP